MLEMHGVFFFRFLSIYFIIAYNVLESTASSEIQKASEERIVSLLWNNGDIWDVWCQLQVKEGECGRNLKRFYYDTLSEQCKPFNFGGCDGNQNNFNTIYDCEDRCKGRRLREPPKSKRCQLHRDNGPCRAIVPRFYYDINDKTCKLFTYGGCLGNENNFETWLSCWKECHKTK